MKWKINNLRSAVHRDHMTYGDRKAGHWRNFRYQSFKVPITLGECLAVLASFDNQPPCVETEGA
jgi:hypothetical protein